MELELAIEAWNGANIKPKSSTASSPSASKRLEIAKASLVQARTTVDQRLVQLYQGGEIDVVEVVLGAASFDDLLDGLDTASRVAEDDARILEDVRSSKAEVSSSGT